MAQAVGARLGHEPWNAIFASPKLRARQTAAPTVALAKMSLQLHEGLREIAYGEWEGRSEKEVASADAARFAAWNEHPGIHAPPGGESGLAIAARARSA